MGVPSLDSFQNIQRLPTLPEQIAKVLDEVSRTTSMDYNLLHVIQYDPCIASRILAVANSPVYGYGKKVDSLQQAAGLLSPSLVNSIILTTPILELHQNTYQNLIKKLDCVESWVHSAVTSQLAGFLGSKVENVESDVCLTYGLVLDIGKIAIEMFYPEEMLAAVELSHDETTPLDAVLQQNLGFSHHEVAATLARGWNYPDAFVSFLQSPEPYNTSEFAILGSVTLLAKMLAEEWGYSDGLGVSCSQPKWEFMERVGISKNDLGLWEPVMQQTADQIARALRTQILS